MFFEKHNCRSSPGSRRLVVVVALATHEGGLRSGLGAAREGELTSAQRRVRLGEGRNNEAAQKLGIEATVTVIQFRQMGLKELVCLILAHGEKLVWLALG